MSTDLYQTLVVVLLGAIVALLILMGATLGRVRKALQTQLRAAAGAPAAATPSEPRELEPRADSDTEAGREERGEEPAAAAVAPSAGAGVATGATDHWTSAAAASPVAAGAPEAAAPAAEPAESSHDERAGVEDEAQREPVAVSSESEDPAGRYEVATAVEADEDPQEQPFEREGRWWFRRGDELLVYEEQTGQWMPAPEPSPSRSTATYAAAPSASGQSGAASSGFSETQPADEAARGSDASSGFWKCPTCGAVNGSTATSCRMCFSTRP